jgi:hypothetical protein
MIILSVSINSEHVELETHGQMLPDPPVGVHRRALSPPSVTPAYVMDSGR